LNTTLLTGVTANAKRKSEVEVLLTVETRSAIFELGGVNLSEKHALAVSLFF
jgi:hypothetical protein